MIGFINLIINNKYDKIDFNLRKYQRYYIRYLFNNKEIFDKNDAINKILKKFGDNIEIKLTDNDISYEKSKTFIKNKKDTLEDILKFLNKDINDLIIKVYDVEYNYKEYNKNSNKETISKRIENIIFFGTRSMFDNLNNNNINQYFIDITYKIVPLIFKPYKLLTIKGFNISEKQSVLCALTFIKYEDEISMFYVFKYLHDFYNFNPSIVNIDFSMSLKNVLNKNEIFDNKPKVVNCFFHFSQVISKKIKSLKIPNDNFKNYMLKKNIQVICFLEKNLVNKYLTFLKSNLSDNDEEKKLFNYLNNYWIKLRGIDSINYYNFI